MKLRKISVLLLPLLITGCSTTNLGDVSLSKEAVYPHNYSETVSKSISPVLKQFNTNEYYEITKPQKMKYTIQTNIFNTQTIDGYGICYVIVAKKTSGIPDGNKVVLFMLNGERVLYSSAEKTLNVVENSRIYNTCNKIQESQK